MNGTLCFVIHGMPVISKNRRPIFRGKSGKPFIGKSRQLRDWQQSAVAQLKAQWGDRPPIEGPVNAKIVTYRAKRQSGDASGWYQAPEDALEAAGILKNDHQIESHDGSRRDRDWENPRVEIELRGLP
ncbi:MAG: RusA family crossover junction endodeoxyribonuclease [Myxococcota bacterium]